MARYQAASLAAAIVLLAVINVTMSVTVQEFFPEIKSNLTKIMWHHKTNNQTELKNALASADVMMIEADVMMGTLTSTPADNKSIPIMAHPPNPSNSSDLSLEDFIKKVTENKKKGFKLDFKSDEAAKEGIAVLQKHGNVTVPVWLNADILVGPVDATDKPLDAKKFLAEASKLPQALLSIGWTTKLEDPTQNVTGKYTTQQIDEMVKVLGESKTNQSVTYPVRALYAANDAGELKSLLDKSKNNNPTLTVWSAEGDKVDAGKLSLVIKSIGVDKVFVDVPDTLRKQLNLSNSAFGTRSSVALILASILAAVKLL